MAKKNKSGTAADEFALEAKMNFDEHDFEAAAAAAQVSIAISLLRIAAALEKS